MSNATFGAEDKLPASDCPVRVNVSSPFPGFSSFRIIFVASLTFNVAGDVGLTTAACERNT